MLSTPNDVQKKLSSLNDLEPSLESLLSLYRTDSEAFFAVAFMGLEDVKDSRLKAVAELASQILAAVRNGFEVLSERETGGEIRFGSRHIAFEHAARKDVLDFLYELDGTSLGGPTGADYSGKIISPAEIGFKLGDRKTWSEEKRNYLNRLNVTPTVFQLSDEDRQAVTNGMPGYIAYELVYCAPAVLAHPTVVFEGIRQEGPLRKGRAYCGLPSRAYDNKGNPSPRPDGMIFVVFVDHQNYVFDWDWIKEAEDKPGYPAEYRDRFARIMQPEEIVLTGLDKIAPTPFAPSRAWYSQRGNCVFVYFMDDPAYAERINEDVTVFKSLLSNDIVGCKIKNIEKRKVKDQPPVAVLIAESLKRQAQANLPTTGYGELISGIENNWPKVFLPKVGKA